MKSIAGKPTAQEGKNCQCAHCDLQGNLMAQVCDLWSNESVEYHPEFGGSSVQCWLGPLGYEVSLMNTAIQTGQEKTLRDLYMISDRARGPEGYILAYDNAYKIGEGKEIQLTNKQLEVLEQIIKDLEALPDNEDKFFEYCDKKYSELVPLYDKKNYGL